MNQITSQALLAERLAGLLLSGAGGALQTRHHDKRLVGLNDQEVKSAEHARGCSWPLRGRS